MISARQALRLALLAVAGAIYVALGHLAAASERPPMLALIVGIVPLAIVVVVAAWNSRPRIAALVLCAVAALALFLNFDRLRGHTAWLYFVQHAGAIGSLAVTFGSTLGRGSAHALCSRIACVVLPTTPDADYMRYTWNVTLAWTVFFAASAVLSVLLFFLGPIEVWSFFANLLTPVLLGAMFAGEYLIRLRVMPGRSHFGIAETIRAYRDYSRR